VAIFLYREEFPTHPFLPWKLGSDIVEKLYVRGFFAKKGGNCTFKELVIAVWKRMTITRRERLATATKSGSYRRVHDPEAPTTDVYPAYPDNAQAEDLIKAGCNAADRLLRYCGVPEEKHQQAQEGHEEQEEEELEREQQEEEEIELRQDVGDPSSVRLGLQNMLNALLRDAVSGDEIDSVEESEEGDDKADCDEDGGDSNSTVEASRDRRSAVRGSRKRQFMREKNLRSVEFAGLTDEELLAVVRGSPPDNGTHSRQSNLQLADNQPTRLAAAVQFCQRAARLASSLQARFQLVSL
jgi:hypothetical protein